MTLFLGLGSVIGAVVGAVAAVPAWLAVRDASVFGIGALSGMVVDVLLALIFVASIEGRVSLSVGEAYLTAGVVLPLLVGGVTAYVVGTRSRRGPS
jgi:hypothetical protein